MIYFIQAEVIGRIKTGPLPRRLEAMARESKAPEEPRP